VTEPKVPSASKVSNEPALREFREVMSAFEYTVKGIVGMIPEKIPKQVLESHIWTTSEDYKNI